MCVFDEEDDRSWENMIVKFFKMIRKRVIQSILTKMITTNSLAGFPMLRFRSDTGKLRLRYIRG